MIYKRIVLIDYIRALAIILVVLGHLRHIYLPNYNGENHLIYFVSSFGHFGVILFFGMSGILASNRLCLIENFKDVWNYLRLRLMRIYLVLPFALIVTFCFDWGANKLNLYSNLAELNIISQDSPPINRMTFELFISNLLSLQTFCTTFFGSNGPLWSLSYEVWFYVLGAILKKTKTPLLSLILILIDLKFVGFFLFWYYIGSIKYFKVSTLVFFLSSGVLCLLHIYKPFDIDLLYCAYFIILYNFFRYKKLPTFGAVSYLAKISFSVYIYHYPILLFTSFLLFEDSVKNFNAFQALTCTSIVFLICVKLYDWIENSDYANSVLLKVRKKSNTILN